MIFSPSLAGRLLPVLCGLLTFNALATSPAPVNASSRPQQPPSAAKAAAATPAVVALEEPGPAVRRVLDRFSAAGFQLDRFFEGPGHLVGVAGRLYNTGMVFYTDREGKTLLIGAAVDLETGLNLTQAAVAAFVPQAPDATSPNPALASALTAAAAQALAGGNDSSADLADTAPLPQAADLEKLAFVSQGASSPTRILYALTDFRCGFCRRAFEASEAWLAKNPTTTIRWVLLGDAERASLVLGTKSYAQLKAAFAPRPTSADALPKLTDDEAKRMLARGAMALENNLDWAKRHPISGTPTFYLVANGRVTRAAGFSPGGFPALLSELATPIPAPSSPSAVALSSSSRTGPLSQPVTPPTPGRSR